MIRIKNEKYETNRTEPREQKERKKKKKRKKVYFEITKTTPNGCDSPC